MTKYIEKALEEPFSAGVVAGAVIGSLLALLLVVTLVGILLSRSQQRHGYPSSGDSIATGRDGSNGGDYSNKARLLFSGAGKNGTGTNNNGPIYTYRGGCDATGTLMGKASEYHCRHLPDPPSTHDILLSCELCDPERKKFDMDESTEEEEERYDHFEGRNQPPADGRLGKERGEKKERRGRGEEKEKEGEEERERGGEGEGGGEERHRAQKHTQKYTIYTAGPEVIMQLRRRRYL
ncbi:hypothetical protein D4764_06G0014220 [Takifugu flavidus]|uniref:Uncharacterized protein n=1 Tax=Takifugu flavidus TaxID=433684 RepID=A0A5C6MXP3_9TELE|nr:hypothetical protein D4764_06G0014220 [Takifugu flavidus]